MLKAFKYRLYPTEDQKILLNKHLGTTRFVYNLALETKISAYQGNKINLSRFDLSAQLVDLKEFLPWLKETNSQSIQQSLKQLDSAYKSFFRGQGFPKFKKKSGRQSFKVPQFVHVTGDRLVIPKFRDGIKMVVDRKHRGSIRSATISKTPTDKYFVSILCETGEPIPEKRPVVPETTVGIDLGLKDLITLSTGEKISQPVRKMRNTKRLQRIISKRVKGSNRRKKLQKRLNKKFEIETNRRNDLLQKVSSEITNRYDTLVVEDLNVRGMMQNHKLARCIGESGWSGFVNMLEYKCLWKGKNLVVVDRWFASSKICSTCGEKYSELRLNEREWTCGACGSVHDRDVNAAINIKNWPVERRCQDVESGSVDERLVRTGPKKHPIGEALKVLEFAL